jgi:ATP-dependent helicase/nuclease subunit B
LSTTQLHRLIASPHASLRRREALAWLAAREPSERLLVVAPGLLTASDLVREAAAVRGAFFGWERVTLGGLAGQLAADALAARGRTTATGLSRQALCARAIHRADQDRVLGHLAGLAPRPGFPRALARTLDELSMAGMTAASLAPSQGVLGELMQRYDEELANAGMADRAMVFRTAIEALRCRQDLAIVPTEVPLLLYDVAAASELEGELLAALVERARAHSILATVPASDEPALARHQAALRHVSNDLGTEWLADPSPTTLARLQRQLFEPDAASGGSLGDDVVLLSTPGESREAVEMTRLILAEAERGVPFDRMAVVLRSPEHYVDVLAEAFERADVPAHFAQGCLRPDPAGRAMLALLACAGEGLSASRFAEYLSLGMVPTAAVAAQAVPWSAPREEHARWVEPEVETDESAVEEVSFPTPRRWERLLVDAAVIGGRDRWARRLDGLAKRLEFELEELDDEATRRQSVEARQKALAGLRRFALPLVSRLDALPKAANWGAWMTALSELAVHAIRKPERVLELLAELAPMAPIGPIGIAEVQLVLSRRLVELPILPGVHRAGRVLVAAPAEIRGMTFDVVLVPGLAEKIFPRKVVEDPLALDAVREGLTARLDRNADRVAAERRALRLAVGAATRRLVLSYPRIDVERSRPRVPSFYGLELLRAAEGVLPGFEELARRANLGAAERMGWPAPASPKDAIDAAEFDLAVLDRLLRRPPDESRGAARYLLGANPHLARSLRFRARRWKPTWTRADGMLRADEPTRAALAEDRLVAQVFSPTALEKYARCPYRFYLSAIVRLSPRPTVEALEDLHPLERGKLVHEVQARLMRELLDRNELPITSATLASALGCLDTIMETVASHYAEELAPAIDRVWRDGVEVIRHDLREWIMRAAAEPDGWRPRAFELAFGLKGREGIDPNSVEEPVSIGPYRLRGSIDLVEERQGALRATDHKTGLAPVSERVMVGGGTLLQPLLYGLALEALEPGRDVLEGRLYYCTSRGGYQERVVPLDPQGRATIRRVLDHIDAAIEKPFLVALPQEGACARCDYALVCGPREEQRTERKPRHKSLELLRDQP